MQLGTRWRFGTTPPNRLSTPLMEALAEVESSLGEDISRSAESNPVNDYWTLTWLEGRAICELDDGTKVMERANGGVAIIPASENLHGAEHTSSETFTSASPDIGFDDDDDDWLKG